MSATAYLATKKPHSSLTSALVIGDARCSETTVSVSDNVVSKVASDSTTGKAIMTIVRRREGVFGLKEVSLMTPK